jgi:hypothetical protein
MKPTLTLLATLLALPWAQAADDAALRSCRVIADDKARLACFDALVPLVASSAPSAPAPAPARFGIEQPAAPAPAESISSSFPGTFIGWEPRQRLRLANGQVWQEDEGTRGAYYLRDPKVTVRRTAFGGYMMQIEGVTQLIRVRRVE